MSLASVSGTAGLRLSVPASSSLAASLYLAPAGLLAGGAARAAQAAGLARPFAGGPLAFGLVRILVRDGGTVRDAVAPAGALGPWAREQGAAVAAHVEALLERLSAPRAALAGLSLDRPRVMGIVNVTPDSFSDGGEHADARSAIVHGRALREAGADILDIGGESTRPGAAEIDPAEEARRVVPVVRALAEEGAVVSVDTRHARVMAESVAAGAAIINDIAALEGDADALAVAARSGAAVVLMHMQGAPEGMQRDPHYDFAPLDVYDYLAKRLAACRAAGIAPQRLVVDPGIGFGKTVDHNVQLIGLLALFHALGAPVLLGVSRKRFIAGLSRDEGPKDRLGGSLAAALAGVSTGAQIVRVHDVAETVQAVRVWQAARNAV